MMAIYTAEAFIQMAKRVLDKYAFHKNRKGEIQSVTEKTTTAPDDLLIIEDSADGYAKKAVKVSAVATTAGSTDANAIHKNVAGEINGILTKATPAQSDVLVIEDSADSWNKKKVTVSALPAPAHTHPIGEVTNLQTELDGKEPVINPKRSAFNKDFGTGPGTVAEGNHNHSGVYAPVSHNHQISDVANLQTQLDGKEPVFTKNTAFNKNFGTGNGDVARGDHNHSGVYEPVINPKNTAFNKNFGTTAGTVAEGNHTHAGMGDMLKSVYDTNDDGVVDKAADVGAAAPGNSRYWGTDAAGAKGYHPLPAGTTDHGALTGLGDDDHPQYLNQARGDARYSQTGHTHTGVYEPVINPKGTAFNKNFGTAAGDVAEGNHTHAGVYEPAFTKNTGFNKNFGTTAGTVAEGNHNHDSAYAPTSHTHTIAQVTNLQSSLDGKLGELAATGTTGLSLVRPKVGTNGQVKRIEAGTGITVVDNTDRLTISASGGTSPVTLHDTGSNLFPVFTDTHRGNKTLSVETMQQVFFRNGTTGGSVNLYHYTTADVNQGWAPHMDCTLCAFSLAIESASNTGQGIDVQFIDAVGGSVLATFPWVATSAGASRVMTDVITANFDFVNGNNITARVVIQGGGTSTDPKVTIYTRWRF